MSLLQSLFALGGLVLACIGYGLLTLSVFRLDQCLRGPLERVCICFVLGSGIFAWLLFYPGVLGAFSPEVFWFAIAAGIHASLHIPPEAATAESGEVANPLTSNAV